MPDTDRRMTEFDKLGLLGKAMFIGGTAIKLVATGIDYALERTTDLIVDIEKSFNDGRDPNIEEAKILEEKDSPKSKKTKS
ncbi:MAG: hypothetical protein HKN43_14985 [Rhodothermales bacterium]|nr:hypothetical protein [Rhodothermales bacterium]